MVFQIFLKPVLKFVILYVNIHFEREIMISLKSVEKHYNNLKEKFENGTLSLHDAWFNAVTLLTYLIDVCSNIDNLKLSDEDKKTYLAYHNKLEQLINEIDYLSDEKTI